MPLEIKIIFTVATVLVIVFGFYLTVIYRIDKKILRAISLFRIIIRILKNRIKKKPITSERYKE